MKTYDKEKLNEYAKELALLCLDKSIEYRYCISHVHVEFNYNIYLSYLPLNMFRYKAKLGNIMPIWELIEKVKQL